jgi:hypothetical protein
LPVGHRSKRRFTHALVVIPGPTEPSDMAVYVRPTLEAFRDFGPDTPGMPVIEERPDGSKREFQHVIFLGGVFEKGGSDTLF